MVDLSSGKPPIDRARLEALAQETPFYKGRFRNQARTPSHGLQNFLKWQLEPGRRFPPGKTFPLQRPNIHDLDNPPADPQLTWIGHSSFLFQFQGLNILTDPVFSDRASPLPFAGPKRYTQPALRVEQLPEIHGVLISHNHYDHLDADTVRQLHRRFGDRLHFFVPLGLRRWFEKRRIHSLTELSWWQSRTVSLGASSTPAEAFCLPTQHFSGRSGTDQNRTLWCSWLLEIAGYRFYFGGDTGYAPVFETIGNLFAPIDLALLPIGAYEPRWFMAPYHIAPEESVKIHQELGARQSVAMHWGTFVLTDEAMDEPPRRLALALNQQQLDPDCFLVLQHGQTIRLPTTLDG